MNFADSLTIQAPVDRVWTALLDVDTVAACLPGVEEVVQVDDRTFDGVISASIGPMSGRFAFRAHILESAPPREMTAEVVGTDSVTKSTVEQRLVMTLEAVGPTETILAYRATVDIKGRLAILGEMVLRATATLLVEEATKRLRTQIEARTRS